MFGGSSHPALTRLVARKVGVRVGETNLVKFANQETSVKLLENVRGQDIYVIQVCKISSQPMKYSPKERFSV